VDIAENTFDNLLATFMIIFAVLLIIKPQRFIKEKFNQTTSIILLFIAFIFIGIYVVDLHAGVGFYFMLTLLILVQWIPLVEIYRNIRRRHAGWGRIFHHADTADTCTEDSDG